MSDFRIRTFIERFPEVAVTPAQVAACEYLERHGKRFCIDFGYTNAESLVWAELESEYACPDCGGIGLVELRSDAADVPCKKCHGDGIYTGRVIRELFGMEGLA